MNQKMLVEQDPHQSRVAVLEEDRLAEIFIERANEMGQVGNVYKGRVSRVLPGMQAAFVNIGLERDAFLYVSEVREDLAVLEEVDLPDGVAEAATTGSAHSIDDLLKPGQEIVVQILKDPMPNKGARVTTHVTLPGRYLVLLPDLGHRGVSRRIDDPEERQRLRQLLDELDDSGDGMIVRTAGEGREREAFATDLEYLRELWGRIRQRSAQARAPSLLHRELDLPLRVVRDLMSAEFSVLWVEGEEAYQRIVEFLDEVQPSLLPRVRLYRRQPALFERLGIDEAIEEALQAKVWLKSGGYIVINPTEALVAIDVNTGRFVGRSNLDQTILETNLEAVKEVVRQIRLRNLGGIIVVDLIDMTSQEHRDQVFAALEHELARDRAKNKVLGISEFGLVEITRKRSRASLERLLTQPCPYCIGRGSIKSMSSICLSLRREVLHQAEIARGRDLILRVHPEVARALQNEERLVWDEMEMELGASLILESAPHQHHERFDIVEV